MTLSSFPPREPGELHTLEEVTEEPTTTHESESPEDDVKPPQARSAAADAEQPKSTELEQQLQQQPITSETSSTEFLSARDPGTEEERESLGEAGGRSEEEEFISPQGSGPDADLEDYDVIGHEEALSAETDPAAPDEDKSDCDPAGAPPHPAAQ